MRSVGKRVSPLAKAGGDFLVAYDLFVVSAL
jgi:hypothetical protein